MSDATPPHFQRLLLTLEAIDAPVVVLWAPAGSGKSAFLVWLKKRSDTRVVSAREREKGVLRRPRQEGTAAPLRWLVCQQLELDTDLLEKLASGLAPGETLVVSCERYPEPAFRHVVIGPPSWRLRPEEVAAMARQSLDPEGFLSTSAPLEGWYRPLVLACGSSEPWAELELFVRSELIARLDGEERGLVEQLAREPLPVSESRMVRSARQRFALLRLEREWGLVVREGADEIRLPRLITGVLSGSRGVLDRPLFGDRVGYRVKLLGTPSLWRMEGTIREPLRWPIRRAFLLLAYLASRPGLAAGRDEVMEALWPEAREDEIARNLHPTVSLLRRTLRAGREDAGPIVLLEKGIYRLDPDIEWWIDVQEFERAVLTGRPIEGLEADPDVSAWEEAWRLYSGPFLPGHEERWVLERREELQRLYLDLLRGLGDSYLQEGRLTDSEDALRSALLVDPIQESVHLAIMTIYARRGRRDLVRRQYERVCSLLQDELGVEPMSSTVAEYHRLMS